MNVKIETKTEEPIDYLFKEDLELQISSLPQFHRDVMSMLTPA